MFESIHDESTTKEHDSRPLAHDRRRSLETRGKSGGRRSDWFHRAEASEGELALARATEPLTRAAGGSHSGLDDRLRRSRQAIDGAPLGRFTAAQRKEFTGLLKQLVQRSYERNIKGILDWNVEYLDEEPAETGVTVHSRATSKSNPRAEPITIDYRMLKASDRFRVYDIVTEGSSLVNNYKNQFNRILQKDGFDALIRRMKSKIEQGGEAHAK